MLVGKKFERALVFDSDMLMYDAQSMNELVGYSDNVLDIPYPETVQTGSTIPAFLWFIREYLPCCVIMEFLVPLPLRAGVVHFDLPVT